MTTNFDKINMLYKNEHENTFRKSIMSLNRKFLGSALRNYYITMIVRLNIVNLLIHNNIFHIHQ